MGIIIESIIPYKLQFKFLGQQILINWKSKYWIHPRLQVFESKFWSSRSRPRSNWRVCFALICPYCVLQFKFWHIVSDVSAEKLELASRGSRVFGAVHQNCAPMLVCDSCVSPIEYSLALVCPTRSFSTTHLHYTERHKLDLQWCTGNTIADYKFTNPFLQIITKLLVQVKY